MGEQTLEPALMTTREAARLLGVSPRTVVRLAEEGHVPAIRLGPSGRWRILRGGVERMVREEPVTRTWPTPTRQVEAYSTPEETS